LEASAWSAAGRARTRRPGRGQRHEHRDGCARGPSGEAAGLRLRLQPGRTGMQPGRRGLHRGRTVRGAGSAQPGQGHPPALFLRARPAGPLPRGAPVLVARGQRAVAGGGGTRRQRLGSRAGGVRHRLGRGQHGTGFGSRPAARRASPRIRAAARSARDARAGAAAAAGVAAGRGGGAGAGRVGRAAGGAARGGAPPPGAPRVARERDPRARAGQPAPRPPCALPRQRAPGARGAGRGG